MSDEEPSGVAPRESWTFKPRRAPVDAPPLSPCNHRWRDDPRIDGRIRAFFADLPFGVQGDDSLWVPVLNSDALAGGEAFAPSRGLRITKRRIASTDGHSIPVCLIAPEDATEPLPCVVYGGTLDAVRVQSQT
mmetsp:Transcript_73077/g.122415  ORF Transcript_73077/g.122415 Transcript_73077/m.122415 type:complete len:133 (-) Transcript_73077:737-1135(-)